MRYLFCMPITGLYDSLTQIERAWQYAKKYDRTLVIDTRISGLHCQFSKLFEIILEHKDIEIIEPSPELEEQTISYPTAPRALQGRAPIKREDLARGFVKDVLSETGESIRIDLQQDYSEPKLIYIRRGGGAEAFQMLSKIHINGDTREEIASRLEHLPDTYIGVHVRNTDVKSNYQKLFRRKSRFLKGKNVLVCSDDQEVIDFAQEFLKDSTVFTTSVERSKDGSPIHVGPNADSRGRSIAVEALVDLVALSQANQLFYTRLHLSIGRRPTKIAKALVRIALRRRPLYRISGFTGMALYLHKNDRVRNSFIEGVNSPVPRSD